MSAREQILSDVRRALAGADRAPVTVTRAYRHDRPADLDLFVERVEDYRATVVRCPTREVQHVVAGLLPEPSRTVVPADLPWHLDGAVLDGSLGTRALDEMQAVVTMAAVGIAVTGTIVLDHGAGQGRRALSLVPDLHVCVVHEDQVVADVPQAVALLDPSRPQTWISGPSATSDIELDRVEGVHGPRTLVVVLVSGPEPLRDPC
ncbi:LutC/YkgG family protein [Nocardioides sp. LHG3406-4]|uniref:LutC/YkgG family protein n=1 Tax=Nocardioides sp. LHG3406-4 TaxID=2804575 RepID=UPI003CF849C2